MSIAINRSNQRGDTIVEVLIVIMVIGTVLASCYGIATSSLQSMQLSQERNYALKLAEKQLEYLKSASVSEQADQTAILAKASGFCIMQNGTSLQTKDIPGGSPTTDMNTDTYAHYKSAGCLVDVNNDNCQSYCYYYGVTRDNTNNYTATVRWDGPRGNKQQVQLAYRVYAQ